MDSIEHFSIHKPSLEYLPEALTELLLMKLRTMSSIALQHYWGQENIMLKTVLKKNI